MSSSLAACGPGNAPRGAAASPDDVSVVAAGPPQPVRAGEYRLSMSARCHSEEKTATGVLMLRPMSGASDGSDADVGEAALLWGQTNLDFGELAGCLGQPVTTPGEPIHPSVLVEVLRWDGTRQHQVLLVSTEAPGRPGGSAGVGVAMWVERAERGHIAGVWSRWELMDRGEGRWKAELISER